MTEPDLLLVVPTFLHFDFALQTVRTALASGPRVSVAVVDDGSPDWPGEDVFTAAGPGRVVTHRFPKNDRNVTRAWEWGARYARDHKIPHVAFGNSDLKFPIGWWDPLRHWLNRDETSRMHLVGPLTNAPGHRRAQDVRRHLTQLPPLKSMPKLTDDAGMLFNVQRTLTKLHAHSPAVEGHLNGFLFAGRTDTLWATSHDADFLFHPHPRFKMVRSEDEICGRFLTRGRRVGAVRSSFVFHYRGVTRPDGRKGRQADGMFRPKGGLS